MASTKVSSGDDMSDIMKIIRFRSSLIPSNNGHRSPDYISIEVNFIDQNGRPVLGPPDAVYLSGLKIHEDRVTSMANYEYNHIRSYNALENSILLPDIVDLTLQEDVVVKCSMLGLTSIHKLEFTTKLELQLWIKGQIKLFTLFDDDLYKELIRRGRVTFKRIDTGEQVYLNSEIVNTPLVDKIREAITRLDVKQYINVDNYQTFIEQYPEDDYIGTDLDVRILAESIGMIIPPYATNVYKYFEDNVRHYDFVVSGSSIIEASPDVEIFDKLGVYFIYSSREDLLNMALTFVNKTGFIAFRPMSKYYADNNKIKGDMPTTYEEQDDIITQGNGIALGHIGFFRMFSYEELYYGVKYNQLPGSWCISTFRPPVEMLEAEIYILTATLLQYAEESFCKEMLDMLTQKRRTISNRDDINNTLRIEYSRLNSEDKELIKEWFENIFLAGMYFRQWDGIGKYPLHYTDTRSKDDDYAQSHGSVYLTKCYEISERMGPSGKKYMQIFPIYQITHHNLVMPSDIYDSVDEYIDIVVDGRQCIRVASSDLITTAHGFKKFILDEDIPDFNILELHPIG